MATQRLSIAQAQHSLVELAKELAVTRERCLIEVAGTPGLALVPADRLEALEETLEIVSNPELLNRVRAGDNALLQGSFISQKEFEDQVGVKPETNPKPGRWRLVVSAPARIAILTLPPEGARPKVAEFLTGPLLDGPESHGMELAGELARRYVSLVAEQRVIWRPDNSNRAVRVVDVHRADHLYVV